MTESAPRFRLIPPSLPDLLANLIHFTRPAHAALEKRVTQEKENGGTAQEALTRTPHFETVRDWVKEDPHSAAKIVLASVYLGAGRFVAQEEIPPPETSDTPAHQGGECDAA